MRVLFVHGACVVDGAWWWQRMIGPLARRGLASAAVELPSCGPANPPPGTPELGDLKADIAAVHAAAAGDEPTLLVGHSYGGMVITGAAADQRNVAGLLYLAAMLPNADEPLAAMADPDSPNWLEAADPDTMRVRADLTDQDFREHFLADCDQAATEGALARLGRQAAAAFGQPPGGAGWRTLPTTAVVCTADRATPPAKQRGWARRAGRVVELDSGHHPFLSRPEELATIIAAAIPARPHRGSGPQPG
jgi:pimeloyl-ACP methyl ester carboxylesterase